MNQLKLNATGSAPAHIMAIGSIKDVINGIVPQDLKNRQFQASDYRFGFELASPHSLESMGEAVVANGLCYTTSTDEKYEHFKTISGKTFYSSGLCSIPKAEKPTHMLMPLHYHAALPYQEFCKQIHQIVGGPCLFASLVRFKKLSATFVQKAPIYHENIFEKKELYYGDFKIEKKDCYFFLVCLVADFSRDNKALINQLSTVLYRNPLDQERALVAHTHGLILNDRVADLALLTPEKVVQAVHLHADNSLLSEVLWGEVFAIDGVDRFIAR